MNKPNTKKIAIDLNIK
jgi:hypothetical protein